MVPQQMVDYQIQMIKFINDVLISFRKCFCRQATYKWFVVVIIGMMLRSDRLGVTSIIRALGLLPKYEPLLNFFRSDASKLQKLETSWSEVVKTSSPLLRVGGAAVMVSDGKKEAHEGRRMPAVKRMHQESENQSKAEHIFGQLFGCVGALAESDGKTYCIPLACELQDGIKTIMSWDEIKGLRQGTHPVEMITLAHRLAKNSFPGAILLMDRYFLTTPTIERLDALNTGGGGLRAIIMAKSNAVAFETPETRKPGTRGAPRKRGKSVKLSELFDSHAGQFVRVDAELYGEKTEIRYISRDLLWGQSINHQMRFVLVEFGNRRAIIASTDITLEPIDIVTLYAKRFSIECTFKSMKHDAAAFLNRFWSKSMPKLNRFTKSGEADRTTKVKTEHDRKAIRKSLDATEIYVFCGAVATGILQMIALRNDIKPENIRYQRTPPKGVLSEAIIADYMRKNFFLFLNTEPDLPITEIIMCKYFGKYIRKSLKLVS